MTTIHVTVRSNATEDGCRRTTSAPLQSGALPRTRLKTVRECRTDRFVWRDRLWFLFRSLRARRLLVCLFYGSVKSGAISDKVVSKSTKVVPSRIRVKTLVIMGFIYYLFLLVAPLKKKVVLSLKANNTNRLHALWHHFLTFCRRSFQQTRFRFLSS